MWSRVIRCGKSRFKNQVLAFGGYLPRGLVSCSEKEGVGTPGTSEADQDATVEVKLCGWKEGNAVEELSNNRDDRDRDDHRWLMA